MVENEFDSLPQVEIFGVTVLEPFNIITNLFITLLCWIAFYRLRQSPERAIHYRLATYFFLIMGFSTAIGGILGHGFLYVTGVWGRLPGWYLSMFAVAMLERAAIIHTRPLVSPVTANILSVVNYIEITIFIALAFITLNFRFVELHAVYGLLVVVFSLEFFVYLKTKNQSGPYFIWATVWAACAGLVHLMEWGINFWFNYNDISHIVMLPSVWCYYRAIDKIRKTASTIGQHKLQSIKRRGVFVV